MRVASKALRDLVIANTIGQALVAILGALPSLGPAFHLNPEQVAAATSAATAALAVWRVLRQQVAILMRLDPPERP